MNDVRSREKRILSTVKKITQDFDHINKIDSNLKRQNKCQLSSAVIGKKRQRLTYLLA